MQTCVLTAFRYEPAAKWLSTLSAGEPLYQVLDSQTITRLLERESRHTSHTPHVAAALTRFAGTALRGPVELDSELAAAPPPPATAATPTLPEQTAHLWQPAAPEPPLSSPHRLSQPIAAFQQARPVKAKLSPELEQAVQAYRQGARTARGLVDALKERGI